MHAALKSFDEKSSTGTAVISLDLSKAFDCLDHELLIQNLSSQNFPFGLIAWIRDYLKDRSAVVRINNEFSDEYPILRGVPQGTVLGPLLFNTFVSDFRSRSNATVVSYADDINIVMSFTDRDPDRIRNLLESEVSNAKSWCEKKKMLLNTEKSACLLNFRQPHYRPTSLPIVEKEVIKVLGVLLNKDFDWSSHINELYKKANQRFHALKQIRPLVDSNDLHRIYNALIRSVLDYCSPVFVSLNVSLSKKLERIDKRAHRIIFRQDEQRTCACGRGNIRERRIQMSLKLFQKINKSDKHILHHILPKKLKYTGKFNIHYCRTQKCQQSFIHFMTHLSNSRK